MARLCRSLPSAFVASFALFCLPAQALVVEGLTNTTTAPGDDPGWLRVNIGGASVSSRNYIYLGNGWALTARHVGAPNPGESLDFFNGVSTVSLGMIPGQNYVIRNPAAVVNVSSQTVLLNTPNGGLETDLRLIRLNGDPGYGPSVPSFTIAELPLSVGEELTVIGHGRTKILPQKQWNTSWQETPPNPGPVAFTGYAVPEPPAPNDNTKRWGKNNIGDATSYQGPTAFYERLDSTTGVRKLTTTDGR
jgi:hypothetical protein